MPPISILFFDRFNAEDPLFLADVGRRLSVAAKQGFRGLVVHAADDSIERVTEAYAGLTDSEEVRELVERSVRAANQSITRRLIDEGVSAVSIQGCDRGLLRWWSDKPPSMGRTDWLERIIGVGTIPVVSSLAQEPDRRTVNVPAISALAEIARALSNSWTLTTVFFTTNRKPRLRGADGSALAEVPRQDLAMFEELPKEMMGSLAFDFGGQMVVTNSAGLAPDGTISGTRIT